MNILSVAKGLNSWEADRISTTISQAGFRSWRLQGTH